MILFFEGKEYKRNLLEVYFGKDHTKVITTGNLRDGKAMLDCVGYYYNPKHSHIFILPKVFVINGKGFGSIEIKDNEPITNSDNIAQILKEEGWTTDVITDLPIYLYRAIDKYRRRKQDTSITEVDHTQNILSSINGKKETSLMDIIISLRDFYTENQNLFVLTYKQNHSGFNKVSWSKTIRKQTPLIQEENVIYPYVVNHRKQINYDEELLILLFNSLRYINNEYHFNITVDQPYNLLPDKEFRKKLNSGIIKKRLLTIKNNYFNEKFVQLWDLLYLFASKNTHIRNEKEKEEYLIVRDFNKVFEDMIDFLIGDRNIPKALLKQKDGKIVDHLFIGQSLTSCRKIYYVGDSKYYKENSTPTGDALFKQYTYAKNIIQTQLDWLLTGKPHLVYRDELTEGYDITPNFFISGKVTGEYNFTSHHLKVQGLDIEKNKQFPNRLFDRDTLFLRLYDVNFLYVIYAYVTKSASIREAFKREAKEIFRSDFIKYINTQYDLYLMLPANQTDIEHLISKYFRVLNGKIFSPYKKEDAEYGKIILGLENNSAEANVKLLNLLKDSFTILPYQLQ